MKFRKRIPFALSILWMLFGTFDIIGQGNVQLDANAFGAIEARHIGPAIMSGRISAVDAVERDYRIVYVGAASGGIWKSTNGGIIFKPVFDKYNQSIGAIAIDQNHPDTVWVGTGEPWVRNSVSVGDGIYKTTNAGETWTKLGLENTEHITRIAINPQNSDILYVAALGHLWNGNPERGLFKTTDAGKTWKKVLYVDENTGCADVTINHSNPSVLFASMWEFRRKPYSFYSGGKGSALYKSTDGGETWTKLTKDLPKGELGRIAVSVSPLNPDIVYADIEAKKSSLYRSDDGGTSWKQMNSTKAVTERPFYFSNIIADPQDTNRVYKPGYNLSVSSDGGKTFRTAYIEGGAVHPDLHCLWVSSRDDQKLYLGTDGGLYFSNDKGSTWRMMRNLPVSQFYHVSIDNAKPYNVYGGLQDNGSWMGPSRSPGGVSNANWQNIGGGDGFYAYVDPNDNDIFFSQYQGGNVSRYYKKTGESKEIKPYGNIGSKDLRFNWNTPVIFSRKVKGLIYMGSQYLHRSINRGDTWETISPDLTTNDPEKLKQDESGGLTLDNSTAENHCTIITISDSPFDENIIWAGTDDGNLQVTTDRGKTWSNIAGNIESLPKNTWCSNVYASNYDKGTAYATFDGHRTGDMKPYIFKTTDFGKTWKGLTDGNIKLFCHVILEDPVSPRLLFVGTEGGLFVTADGGNVWAQFTGNLPPVSVMDLAIQPRENDLVLATHGRGIIIIDDLTPLRALTEDVLKQEAIFLPSRPYYIGGFPGVQSWTGDDEFTGRNPQDAAIISYYLQKRHIFGDMSVEVYNPKGELLQKLPAGSRKGINRIVWTPRQKPPKVPPSNTLAYGALIGPNFMPGDYTIRLLKGGKTYEGKVTLKYDPDLPHSNADRDLQLQTLTKGYNMLENLAFIDRRLTNIIDQCRQDTKSKDVKPAVVKSLNAFADKLEAIHKQLVATKEGDITGEEQLRERISGIYGAVIRYLGRPTQSQIDRLDILEKELNRQEAIVQNYINADLARINSQLKNSKMDEIKVLTIEEYKKKDK